MSGKLSTHVLDTVHGCPAQNMQIELWAIAIDVQTTDQKIEQKTLLKTLYTNQDGRTDELLLNAEEMQVGIYEIWFNVSDYFATHQVPQTEPAFLSRVPIRFGISDISDRYHVPLLVSPWAYSTYRGS
jgi:5-hydroxyisourate hydrolase